MRPASGRPTYRLTRRDLGSSETRRRPCRCQAVWLRSRAMITMGDASLVSLFRYDAWANDRSFAAAAALAPDARSEGVTRTLFDLLSHLTGTEEGYLQLLRGTLEANLEQRRAWYRSPNGDLARLHGRAREVSEEYLAHLASAGADELERCLLIPWLKTKVSAREALLQVIVHSIEHRADVSTVLTRNGVTAPALDLVYWIVDGRPRDVSSGAHTRGQ